MQELNALQQIAELWQGLYQRAVDARDLAAMAEDDPDMLDELADEAASLEEEFERRQFSLALAGPHDSGPAIFSIFAGAGGTEAQDWAQMLLRMYLRWAENKRYKTVITDMTEGEEAGIKSVTVEVDGPFAYGYLKAEKGTHRLVRLSPYDSNSRRHTSFAKVEVIPVLDEDIDVQIDPNDLQIEVFLSGGRRRAERPEERHRRPHPSLAHRHRRHLPEQAQPDPEPRVSHACCAASSTISSRNA